MLQFDSRTGVLVDTANLRAKAREAIDKAGDRLKVLSDGIHATPELGFEELRSSAAVAATLAESGFQIESPIAGLPTAFRARHGEGSLHIAFCAEYDALPDIGHACGHNLIATMAVGAAIGLATCAKQLDVTVLVLGTPAEEGGGGKAIMLERGAFDGVHAAMLVHPAPFEVLQPPMIALRNWTVRYAGRAAHAAIFPEQGVNALDALTIAQVAIGLLRQHLPADVRLHGIVTDGGEQANVVPERSSASWYLRAETVAHLAALEERVRACFEAGALATGATCTIDTGAPRYADVRHDPDLAALYQRHGEALGRRFTEDPDVLARLKGSTDMGNVSQVIPTIHPTISIDSLPAVNHQREFTECCIGTTAMKAAQDGATAMALTAIDAASDPVLRQRLLDRRLA